MEYLLTFLEGIVSFISPCVLPMIPIYVTYIVGTDNIDDKSAKIAFRNSVGFVLGFSIVFILLSIFASTLGSLVSKYMNIIQIVFGAVMVIFGLNFMEVVHLDFLNLTSKIKMRHDKVSFLNSLLFGILFSVTWTPCIGAFLGTALMMIATEGEFVKGILMMVLFSLGLGIPFIISAVLIEKMKNAFKVIKKNYKIIKILSGIFLIIIGFYTILK